MNLLRLKVKLLMNLLTLKVKLLRAIVNSLRLKEKLLRATVNFLLLRATVNLVRLKVHVKLLSAMVNLLRNLLLMGAIEEHVQPVGRPTLPFRMLRYLQRKRGRSSIDKNEHSSQRGETLAKL